MNGSRALAGESCHWPIVRVDDQMSHICWMQSESTGQRSRSLNFAAISSTVDGERSGCQLRWKPVVSVQNVQSGSGVEGEMSMASWMAFEKKSRGEDVGPRSSR